MKKRPLIIPIFIPQEGCRHRCVYCDQATISGLSQASWSPSSVRTYVQSYLARIFHESSSPDLEDNCATGSSQGLALLNPVTRTRHRRDSTGRAPEAYLKSTSQSKLVLSLAKEGSRTPGFRLVEPTGRREGRPYPQSQQAIHEISGLRSNSRYPIQVAFYGGSFTLLPEARQRLFLEPVQEFLKQGQVHSLRLSTRPDAIEVSNLRFLQSMGVRTIELGVQSLSDKVLFASARGHSSKEVYGATLRLQQYGFEVGLQLMPGLPGDNQETFLQTVEKSIALNPSFVRLYPTVVLSSTPLERFYRSGRYRPLSLREAVDWCKEAKRRFASAAIPVIRMGLQPTRSLEQPGRIVAGPYHPAFGQLVNSAIWNERISPVLKKASQQSPHLVIHAYSCHLADIRGHRNDNINRWRTELNLTSLETVASAQIGAGGFKVTARRED